MCCPVTATRSSSYQRCRGTALSSGVVTKTAGLFFLLFYACVCFALSTTATSFWSVPISIQFMQSDDALLSTLQMKSDQNSIKFLTELHILCVCVWVCRNYSVVNVDKGKMEVKRMPCPGSRISSQMKMGNTLWMATEVHLNQPDIPFQICFHAHKCLVRVSCCVQVNWIWLFLSIFYLSNMNTSVTLMQRWIKRLY